MTLDKVWYFVVIQAAMRFLEKRRHLAEIEFTTAEFIRFLTGGFHSEIGVSAPWSTNAAIGRALSRLAWMLGIKRVRKVSVVDDRGHRTTSMIWRIADTRHPSHSIELA